MHSAVVPAQRVQAMVDAPPRAGRYVLYWMTAARRTRFNFALDRARQWGTELGLPVVVLEALRLRYPWASPRFHRFIVDGMYANQASLSAAGVRYHPYVEPSEGHGQGLLAALAAEAAVVVGDDCPMPFLVRMTRAAAAHLQDRGVRFEVVDGNGLYPMRSADRAFTVAHSFRRHLQKELPKVLHEVPAPALPADMGPRAELPAAVLERWPAAPLDGDRSRWLAALPLDGAVGEVALEGGEIAAGARLRSFLNRLSAYEERRNHPDDDGGSGLSPYLHFGHLSAHEVFQALIEREEWGPERLAEKASGGRSGWWGLSASAEAFLDQLVTWREIGFNAAVHLPAFDKYASLPEWARATLATHAHDPRPALYGIDRLAEGATDDPVWNAAQRQLVETGVMHNYLRMLWGKLILAWSPSPEEALGRMIELNNRYALDGRDPNSYSGIFWCLGRYDRAWGPERPIFGKVRYMTSKSTLRKLRMRNYLVRFGTDAGQRSLSLG